jgi:Zn-dependent peptidase ImmA (M78 family)
MSTPLWADELARAFWARADGLEPFPRQLLKAVHQSMPLTVEFVPGLKLSMVQARFDVADNAGRDRSLRACVWAKLGGGWILIEDQDDEDEKRFSLAHELGHFLQHYWGPRERIAKFLGPKALEVVDGNRSPTPEERLHALLRDVPIRVHLHLMERDNAGRPANARIAQAEDDADRLAYELLAPAEHLWTEYGSITRAALATKLRNDYGLPHVQAQRYAEILTPMPKSDSLILRLRTVLTPEGR